MSTPRSDPRAPVLAMENDLGGRIGEVVSADGVPVRYAVYGGGLPAIVFVHGWSCDRRYWLGQVGHFADRFTVVTVDLAGHGESGAGRRSWTMPAFGEDVAAVVTGLDLPQLVLVGHSMGGDVVIEAARRLRPRVRGLVWVDVYRRLDESRSDAETAEETATFMAPFRADFSAATRAFVRRIAGADTDPDLVEWIAEDMAAAPPQLALDAMRHAISNEPAAIAGLHHAAVRAAAINPGSPPTDIESLARHGIATTVLPAVGHFLMLQDPAGFNQLLDNVIEDFLTGGEPSPATANAAPAHTPSRPDPRASRSEAPDTGP
jgi:pimeloyl-ACP methyl ester carboxylesterase